MTSESIHHTTRLANLIGEPRKVHCRYEWDRVKRTFVWAFYRGRVRIGQTAKPDEVVKKMTAFTTTN